MGIIYLLPNCRVFLPGGLLSVDIHHRRLVYYNQKKPRLTRRTEVAMQLEIGFGNAPQTVELPDENVLDVLYPNGIEAPEDSAAEVARALSSPIGTLPLAELAKGRKKVAIVTSDITRPMPSKVVLPLVLNELFLAGISPQDITVVFALGSHRKQTEEEKIRLAGEDVYRRVRCVDSADFDFVHMGSTKCGTPVDICRPVAEADLRICLGNIEYHYFAGYSGGAKAIMPGVSTRAAIQANHSYMVKPNACAGVLDDNPLREDLEDALNSCPVDFIVNVVLDEHKKIVHCVCGDVIEAHRAGCRLLDRYYRKNISRRADIVLVSQGGHPKDLNLYQTQKALENAKYAVRDGGIIILVGSCNEGMGESTFEDWMLSANEPDDLIRRIEADFRLGGHKAAAIALVLKKADIYLVSDMKADFVRQIFMTPFSSVQQALDEAFRVMGPKASVIVMPYGGSTLPHLSA